MASPKEAAAGDLELEEKIARGRLRRTRQAAYRAQTQRTPKPPFKVRGMRRKPGVERGQGTSKHARHVGWIGSDGQFRPRRAPLGGGRRSKRLPLDDTAAMWLATKPAPWSVRAANRKRNRAARAARKANR